MILLIYIVIENNKKKEKILVLPFICLYSIYTQRKPCAMKIASTVWEEIFSVQLIRERKNPLSSDEFRVRAPGNPI